MKQLIISGMVFLFLSGALAGVASGQESKPVATAESNQTSETANKMDFTALKNAFKYGLSAGWGKAEK